LFEEDTGKTYFYDGYSWKDGAWKNAFDTIKNVAFLDENGTPYGIKHTENRPHVMNYVWDVAHLGYVVQTQPVINTDTLTVSGSMSVSNFPATQPVSGEVLVTDYDPTAKYKITDIDPTTDDSYYGYTDKDGGWYIKHITATAVRYVKGDSGYAAAWDLRADPGTVYYYFYEVFS